MRRAIVAEISCQSKNIQALVKIGKNECNYSYALSLNGWIRQEQISVLPSSPQIGSTVYILIPIIEVIGLRNTLTETEVGAGLAMYDAFFRRLAK